jgi:hypothetical protein
MCCSHRIPTRAGANARCAPKLCVQTELDQFGVSWNLIGTFLVLDGYFLFASRLPFVMQKSTLRDYP